MADYLDGDIDLDRDEGDVSESMGEVISFREYQQKALRTFDESLSDREALMLGGMGTAGEAGEVCDYLKKVAFHGHTLDDDILFKEMGDVMWYLAVLAHRRGTTLDRIAKMNIIKLEERYPERFDPLRSQNREDGT